MRGRNVKLLRRVVYGDYSIRGVTTKKSGRGAEPLELRRRQYQKAKKNFLALSGADRKVALDLIRKELNVA